MTVPRGVPSSRLTSRPKAWRKAPSSGAPPPSGGRGGSSAAVPGASIGGPHGGVTCRAGSSAIGGCCQGWPANIGLAWHAGMAAVPDLLLH